MDVLNAFHVFKTYESVLHTDFSTFFPNFNMNRVPKIRIILEVGFRDNGGMKKMCCIGIVCKKTKCGGFFPICVPYFTLSRIFPRLAGGCAAMACSRKH